VGRSCNFPTKLGSEDPTVIVADLIDRGAIQLPDDTKFLSSFSASIAKLILADNRPRPTFTFSCSIVAAHTMPTGDLDYGGLKCQLELVQTLGAALFFAYPHLNPREGACPKMGTMPK
jgi:hypothetical protein